MIRNEWNPIKESTSHTTSIVNNIIDVQLVVSPYNGWLPLLFDSIAYNKDLAKKIGVWHIVSFQLDGTSLHLAETFLVGQV